MLLTDKVKNEHLFTLVNSVDESNSDSVNRSSFNKDRSTIYNNKYWLGFSTHIGILIVLGLLRRCHEKDELIRKAALRNMGPISNGSLEFSFFSFVIN